MPTATAYFAQPKLLIDGQSEDLLAGDLVAMQVEETIAGLYRCELRFNNFGQRTQGTSASSTSAATCWTLARR